MSGPNGRDKNDVRKDIVKAIATESRRKSDNIDDRRHLESWPIYGDIDTRAYTKRKMSRDDRLEGGAVAVLDQAMFGYGDKVLARVKGGSDAKKVADEEKRLDVLQNELRDQYPAANIGARALGAIGPLMLGRKLARPVLRKLLSSEANWPMPYGARMALGLGGVGALGAGYTYQKNKPRSGSPFDGRGQKESLRRKK